MAARTIREDFDSFDAWLSHIETAPQAWRGGANDAPSAQIKLAWYGAASVRDALALGRYGWPEGRAKMAAAIAVVAKTRRAAPVYRYDVAGAYPDVPRAVAGDPCCMRSPRKSTKARSQIIRINYGRSTLSNTPSAAIINRGAALLSIVDGLEAVGFRVEFRLVFKTQDDDAAYHSAVTVKNASDPLDLDRAAFALVNPSVLRRLAFACREARPELKSFGSTMGFSDYSPWIDDEPATVFVPAATGDDLDPAAAREAVERCFADYMERDQ